MNIAEPLFIIIKLASHFSNIYLQKTPWLKIMTLPNYKKEIGQKTKSFALQFKEPQYFVLLDIDLERKIISCILFQALIYTNNFFLD